MTEGKCPSCGAPVAFTAGSAQVLVCEHCQAVVARKDASLEAHGKVARIVDTDSPLQLGVRGRYRETGFAVVGRLQKSQGTAPWNEWYLQLDDGSAAWLSESEGAYRVLVFAGMDSTYPRASLRPTLSIALKGKPFVVEEVGTAKTVAAEGQLPSDVDPAVDCAYADATGPGGVFGTLDFGPRKEGAEVYLGHEVTLDGLAIAADQLRPRAKQVGLAQARCPQCDGTLALRAPDKTRRVGCPFCGALLDASQGKLAFLQLLGKPEHAPKIPLGARGKLGGTEWTCLAFLVRSCVVEGTIYPWDEYLLFHRARGFAWLVEYDGHWVFLVPVNAGDVALTERVSARYQGRQYRCFQSVTIHTNYVLGECYWEVSTAEKVDSEEYVCPPYSLSVERSDAEVSLSHGEYLGPEVVKNAFRLAGIDRPKGIASSQPNPHGARSALAWAGVYAVAILTLFLVQVALAANERVLDEQVAISAEAAPGTPEAMVFTPPFDIHRRGNVEVDVTAPALDNNWLGLEGDLVEEGTGEVTSFYLEASYYQGADSDGAWSEGGRHEAEYLSAVPPGRYSLRLTPHFDPAKRPAELSVQVRSDVPRSLWMFLALLALGVWPMVVVLRSSAFESARWRESNLVSSSDD